MLSLIQPQSGRHMTLPQLTGDKVAVEKMDFSTRIGYNGVQDGLSANAVLHTSIISRREEPSLVDII